MTYDEYASAWYDGRLSGLPHGTPIDVIEARCKADYVEHEHKCRQCWRPQYDPCRLCLDGENENMENSRHDDEYL